MPGLVDLDGILPKVRLWAMSDVAMKEAAN
jgi:hypothetical protein